MSAFNMTEEDKVAMAHDLRRSVKELRDRGLIVAAKWASELLMAIPRQYRSRPRIPFSPPPQPLQGLPSPRINGRPSMGDFLPPPGPLDSDMAGPSRARTGHGIELEEEDQLVDEDEFQLGKSYFDMKEFDRVVWVLKEAKGKRAKFLRIYSAYLSADRKAQESLPHFLDTKQERLFLFGPLTDLLQELGDDTDPYLTYLRGILHMRLGNRQNAADCFLPSLREKPYNWSCWSQLAQLANSADMFIELKDSLPPGPMLCFFGISVMLDLHTATDVVMSMINDLYELFPTSAHLKAQGALVYYHMRDFEAAEREFDAMQQADPFRMEEVDIYSNMLYVMDKKAKLGKLAHEYAEVDPHRAEVCCLIGNYYSSRSDHTKAITYFKRSLMLNREYLPAWTLMGHEFVELKNSHAAIEAYRKAIDVNAKDYRAWYGLGQAYELLDMPMYAIEYYDQATSLRPYDCRMWTALATVYESLQRLPNAIEAHTRALLGADRLQTPNILSKLASLHTSLNQTEEAISCHRKVLALGESGGTSVAEMAGSYLAVAEWEMRSGSQGLGLGPAVGGDLGLAATYLEKLAQTNAPQRDRAEEMLRELKVRQAGL